MSSYRKNMASAVRWSVVVTAGVSTFWLIWKLITGSVPTILNIRDALIGTASLPFPYGRGWDALVTFIAIPTLWSLLFGLFKLAPHLGIKQQPRPTKLRTNLIIWLGLGLLFGLLLSALKDEPIVWLGFIFGMTAGDTLLTGYLFGWGVGLVSGLGFWLGECLGFGLIFGLGIGWVAFVVGVLVLSLIGTPVATLVIGLRPGFISKPWPRLRGWLAATDIKE